MGSHADDIVGDYFETEDWGSLVDAEADPELELPPSPPPSPRQSAA
jgi:hypothetical protein